MRHRCCMCHRSTSPFLFVSRSMLGAMQPTLPWLLPPSVSAPGCANRARGSDRGYEVVVSRLSSLSISFFELELARHPCLSAAKHWIELDPRHIGFGDIGDMASRTFGHRLFRGGLIVGQRVMPESEEAPAVGLSKTLAVFQR